MGVEPVNEEDQDQVYFVEPSKPPHHSIYIPLFVQACFCFQNKIMHVLILL